MTTQPRLFRYDEYDEEAPAPHAGANGGRVWAALMRRDAQSGQAAPPGDRAAVEGPAHAPPARPGDGRCERYKLFELLARSLEMRLLE